MHILYIHQYFTTPEKGGATRSYEFARRLADRGHRVTMVTGNKRFCLDIPRRQGFARVRIDGIDVVVLPVDYSNYMERGERIKSFLSFAWRAARVGMCLPRPDLVFATSTPLTVGIPAMFLSARHRVPLVFEVRDLWPEAPIQMGAIRNPLLIWMLRCLERLIYRRSSRIIALSPGMVRGVVERGVDGQKIAMIPNSSDNELFTPGPPDPEFLSRWGLQDRFIIAYAGAMGEANGLDLVAEAAALIKQWGDSSAIFALAGDGKLRPALEEEVRSRGLDNVVFLGNLNKFEVVQLYRGAGAAIVLFKDVPVLHTNSPNKFFDALAAGLPVIANMPGWIENLLQGEEAGISIPPGDPAALAEAVLRLQRTPVRRSIMGQNARHLAETRFDRDYLADLLEKVLSEQVQVKEKRRRRKGSN